MDWVYKELDSQKNIIEENADMLANSGSDNKDRSYSPRSRSANYNYKIKSYYGSETIENK